MKLPYCIFTAEAQTMHGITVEKIKLGGRSLASTTKSLYIRLVYFCTH